MDTVHPTSDPSGITAQARAYSVEPFFDAWLVSIVRDCGIQVVHFVDTEEEAHAKALEVLTPRQE